MPASEEFVSLCRSQVAILTEGLGAALSVVYLTEELTEATDAKLVPLVAHPEAAADWEAEQVLALLTRAREGGIRLLNSKTKIPALPASSSREFTEESSLLRQQQMVLPLIHEGIMMGLLVTARADRPWSEQESAEIEQVAHTLAIACVLDQRAQWVEQDLRQQRLLQAQQHDIFDDLLHQFRNPLTALRTFGKLLVRRLLPGDANQEVAAGIVRESDRLQELLKQFDVAIDLGEADLLPMAPDSVSPTVDWKAQLESPQRQPDAVKSVPLLPSASYLTGAELNLEPHAVAEVLGPLLVAATAIAQERHLTLEVNLPADLPPVLTDLKALREVLNNLLDNALKYTPAGGKLYLIAGLQRPDEGRQGIAVVDTGVGIPPQDQEHLFERHYRGVQASSDIPGSGLGLAIAHDLIHQMQGEIQVFSPAGDSGLAGLEQQATGTALIVWLRETKARELEPKD